MRKESSNQFSDGLINDLNPINTPNNILTDNLNGTIITYNGNEYSLQNDMGNYKLQNCKLKPNYVPVGIKEYGDILYIVSYNPLNEHVEIGSYPAPEQLQGNEGSKDGSGSQTLNNLFEGVNEIETKSGEKSNTYRYSDLIKNSSLATFYDGDDGVLFLNPGDEYKLTTAENKIINDSNLELYSSEYIKHFVVDENRRLYDVQWAIDKQVSLDDFKHVGWDVPGWLALKVELANFEEFNVNVRRVSVPLMEDTNFKSTIDLDFQLKIKDASLRDGGRADLQNNGFIYLAVYKNDSNNTPTDLLNENDKFIEFNKLTLLDGITYYQIPFNSESTKLQSESGYIDWYPDANIYHLNPESFVTASELNKSDIITIVAIPGITAKLITETETIKKDVLYDNFKFEQNVSLNDVGSIETLTLGNSIFKFWVDKNEDGKPEYFSIEYNVEGPFTQSSSVNLYYAIYDVQNFTSEKRVTPYKLVEGFNGIGQNTTQIPFDPLDEVDDENNVTKIHNWYYNWSDYVEENDKDKIYPNDNKVSNDINKVINSLNNPDIYNTRSTSNRFEAESYYLIKFIFAESINDVEDEKKSKCFEKLIITSDVFNNLHHLDSPTATDWIGEFYKKINYDITINNKSNIISTATLNFNFSDKSNDTFKTKIKNWFEKDFWTWGGESQNKRYDGWITQSDNAAPFNVVYGFDNVYDIQITFKNLYENTVLWKNIINESKKQININNKSNPTQSFLFNDYKNDINILLGYKQKVNVEPNLELLQNVVIIPDDQIDRFPDNSLFGDWVWMRAYKTGTNSYEGKLQIGNIEKSTFEANAGKNGSFIELDLNDNTYNSLVNKFFPVVIQLSPKGNNNGGSLSVRWDKDKNLGECGNNKPTIKRLFYGFMSKNDNKGTINLISTKSTWTTRAPDNIDDWMITDIQKKMDLEYVKTNNRNIGNYVKLTTSNNIIKEFEQKIFIDMFIIPITDPQLIWLNNLTKISSLNKFYSILNYSQLNEIKTSIEKEVKISEKDIDETSAEDALNVSVINNGIIKGSNNYKNARPCYLQYNSSSRNLQGWYSAGNYSQFVEYLNRLKGYNSSNYFGDDPSYKYYFHRASALNSNIAHGNHTIVIS